MGLINIFLLIISLTLCISLIYRLQQEYKKYRYIRNARKSHADELSSKINHTSEKIKRELVLMIDSIKEYEKKRTPEQLANDNNSWLDEGISKLMFGERDTTDASGK